MLDALESPESIAEQVADCWRLTGHANCVTDDWQRYKAVTPADVQRVAELYLLNVPPNTLSNVPRGDKGALPGSVVVELP
jgi:predicted Zn-dependent peptidase